MKRRERQIEGVPDYTDYIEYMDEKTMMDSMAGNWSGCKKLPRESGKHVSEGQCQRIHTITNTTNQRWADVRAAGKCSWASPEA